MAENLVPCKTCGKEVAKSASICIHCGEKLKMGFLIKALIGFGVFIGLIIAVGIGISLGSGDNSKQSVSVAAKDQVAQKAIKIDSVTLWNEYKANEVAADAKYKGKILEISGEVTDIKKDISDTMYVALKGDKYIGSVKCSFPKEWTEQLMKLQKGQILVIKGECEGLMMVVNIKKCEIINKSSEINKKPEAEKNNQNNMLAQPLNIDDCTIGSIKMSDSMASVRGQLGNPMKESKNNSLTKLVYKDLEIEVDSNRNNTVVGVSTNSNNVYTKRNIHQTSSLEEVKKAYGENYNKTSWGDLDLYEYDFVRNDNVKYILRFAVNKSDNKVNYFGCRIP